MMDKVYPSSIVSTLESTLWKDLLPSTSNCSNDIHSLLVENVTSYILSGGDSQKCQRECEILQLAVSCLEYFVQNNWTGPPGQFDPSCLIPASYKDELTNIITTSMEVDGESIYELTKYPLALFLARSILCQNLFSHHQLAYHWWWMRCCKIHQDLLKERSPSLKCEIDKTIDYLQNNTELKDKEELRHQHLEFLLESANLYEFYYERKKAHEVLDRARELADIEVGLTGVMGKRTRFQESDMAQLICRITTKPNRINKDLVPMVTESGASLPKDLPLQHEYLLEKIQFTDDKETTRKDLVKELHPVESALVMTLCLHNKKNQASSTVEEDETKAYIDCILDYPCCWSVLSRALTMRSSMEKKQPKRLERSLQQLEEILNQYRRQEPDVSNRIAALYASEMKPIWHVEKELAHLYISFGSMDTALEIFIRLQLWAETIECYTQLGRLERAESVIRERLELGETPDLYCYLGDVTKDAGCYEKAWTLSRKRSSRAQKSWAFHLFYKGEFKESIEHFEASLEINQLQVQLWFTFGCACMAVKELNKAIHAFRRCVSLEYDNFQGWTNLSSCCAKNNDKHKAFRILEEAIRCNYENHRIWENYVTIGLDCGEFENVIRGYHRLLDLKVKDKYADVDVLGILVRAVNENLDDCNGKSASYLRPKLQELLGRQTSLVTTNAMVWKLYGNLISHVSSGVEDKAEKAMQYYQKSQRCITQTDDFLTDIQLANDVITETDSLLTEFLRLSDSVESKDRAVQLLASIKLTTQNVLTKIKNKHRNLMGELVPELVTPCQHLTERIEEITNKILLLNT